jgi:hypothetical protein
VIGVQRSSAERDGKRLDVGLCLTFELKDGRVVDGREHFFDLYDWTSSGRSHGSPARHP